MFTDWTVTDPHYFYQRGVMLGFVWGMVIFGYVIPKLKEAIFK